MYLNQKATWLRKDYINSYGDVEYRGAATLVAVRRQEHKEELSTPGGNVYHTNYIYYTHEDVNVNDKLDGFLVVDIYDMRTLGGARRLRRVKTV